MMIAVAIWACASLQEPVAVG